jgi:hypothetical protein
MTGTLDFRFQRVAGSNVCITHLFFLLQVTDDVKEEATPAAEIPQTGMPSGILFVNCGPGECQVNRR